MLVCALLSICTRDRGCSVHPAFPAPSVPGGAKLTLNSGAMVPRERGVAPVSPHGIFRRLPRPPLQARKTAGDKTAARKNEFHQPIQRDLGRPARASKIIRFSFLPNRAPSSRHPASSKRGVRVVTIRGVRGAVDAMALRARGIAGRPQALSWGCERLIRAGRAALLRTAKACGSGTRGWCQARRRLMRTQPGSIGRQSGSDGGKRNSSPGRARHKPSNHCAGKAGCSPLDLYARVRTSLCHCTRDRGCSAHPVFPAPSHFEEGKRPGTTRARRAARTHWHIRISDLIRFPPIIIPS